MDAETRDAIRDLCEGVAELAARCVHLIGVDAAAGVTSKALRLTERMDYLDEMEADASF